MRPATSFELRAYIETKRFPLEVLPDDLQHAMSALDIVDHATMTVGEQDALAWSRSGDLDTMRRVLRALLTLERIAYEAESRSSKW